MNSILLDTLKGRTTIRPPLWFMRQAGRVLPSYHELRERYSFFQLMSDPDLAAEVTLLPVKDLGVDGAILFSDILVIPAALGMSLVYTDSGPRFEWSLRELGRPLDELKPDPGKLSYIYKVIDRIMLKKPENVPLIGFAGAPLTVLLYMIDREGYRDRYQGAVKYIYCNRSIVKDLTSLITNITIEYAINQVSHGIEVFQLFDTHGGIIPFDLFREFFLPSVKKISEAVRQKGIPFIYFPKDIGAGLSEITPDICDFVSIDWQTSLPDARKLVDRRVGLQGNLDPRLLFARKDHLDRELKKYIDFGMREQNWIFNLGHGFLQGTPFGNAAFIAENFRNAKWDRK